MKIVDHRLLQADGTPVPFVESPNHGEKLKPDYLILHYTATASAKGAIRWLTNPEAKASAHLVIGRDGTITQLVPFDTIAWHAGNSSWEGRVGLNRYSIGIEIDNAGKLTRHGNRWRAWFGGEYEADDVLEATHKHETTPAGWHLYTPEQLEAVLNASLAIVRHYGLKDVLGHEDIAPGRKTDPGPAFPMQSVRAHLLGRLEEAPVVYETTTTLNVRGGAGTQFATVPGSPLPPGTRLEVLAQQGTWRQIDVMGSVNGVPDVQGWVHQKYLKRAD